VVSSVSEDVLSGSVTGISREATTSSGVTTYSAEVCVDVQENMIPGMTAEVDIRIEGTENAMIIPADALHQTSAIYFVYTSYDEETQQYGGMTEVTIGMQNDSYVEILTGLNLGDTVYYTEKQPNWFGFAMGGRNTVTAAPSGGNRGGNQRPDMGGMGPGGQR